MFAWFFVVCLCDFLGGVVGTWVLCVLCLFVYCLCVCASQCCLVLLHAMCSVHLALSFWCLHLYASSAEATVPYDRPWPVNSSDL